MSYLVLDIETIPDLKIWQPPKVAEAPVNAAPDIKPVKKSRAKKPPKAPEDVFPPLFAHKIVAIGFTQLSHDFDIEAIGCVGTSTFGDNERMLLNGFAQWAAKLNPTLVTFSGRTFDIPVLNLRALHHGVPQAWYTRNHRHRYGDEHVDVFDQLTEFGAVQRTGYGLDSMCTLIGLPTKSDVNGSKVAAMIAAGEAARVEGYCTCDTVKTAFLLMRLRLLRGAITLERYQTVAGALLQHCVEKGLGGVTFGAKPALLLLQDQAA